MTQENSLRYSIMNYLVQNPGEIYTVSSDGSVLVADGVGDVAKGALVGTVQVNLPRISYESAGKDERFLQGVAGTVDEAVNALELRGRAVQDRMKEGILPLLSWTTDGSPYYGSHPLGEVSLLGLSEAVRHHLKKDIEAKDSLVFVKKIIESARRAILENDSRKLGIRVGLHPSPEASSRLATIDSEKYGFSTVLYQGSKRYPYYTDIPVSPETQKIPFATRALLEGEVQRYIDGGTVLPLLIGDKTDATGLMKATRQLAESGVRHFTFSKILSRCQSCHHVDTGVRSKCSTCNSDRLTIIAKHAGRLVPVDLWTEARRKDLEKISAYEFA